MEFHLRTRFNSLRQPLRFRPVTSNPSSPNHLRQKINPTQTPLARVSPPFLSRITRSLLSIVTMASRACITRCMHAARTSRSSTTMSSLNTSLRALSLRRASATPSQQTRAISSTILPTGPRIRGSLAVASGSSAAPSVVAAVRQQARGMKVLSSIKKRCEHCKVSDAFRRGGIDAACEREELLAD